MTKDEEIAQLRQKIEVYEAEHAALYKAQQEQTGSQWPLALKAQCDYFAAECERLTRERDGLRILLNSPAAERLQEIKRLRAALERIIEVDDYSTHAPNSIKLFKQIDAIAREALRPADELDTTPEHLMKQGYRSGRAADETTAVHRVQPDGRCSCGYDPKVHSIHAM